MLPIFIKMLDFESQNEKLYFNILLSCSQEDKPRERVDLHSIKVIELIFFAIYPVITNSCYCSKLHIIGWLGLKMLAL
jgi:hypothetical protein